MHERPAVSGWRLDQRLRWSQMRHTCRPMAMTRKRVTIVFCDVAGSTALGESIDPEALRSLLARYFERMGAIVSAHGGGEEKVLKNAKDACASEALEIATYAAIERLAQRVGDDETAKLAASIRADEERMLARVRREIPKLTDAVVRADVDGDSSYDVKSTGAADALREAGEVARSTATKTAASAKRTARQARKVPGVARAEGQVKGAVASEEDLAIARYDTLTAEEITGKLPELSQIDLAKIEAYERKNQNRTTILSRVTSLRSDEPWAGYDELTAAEVIAVLSEGDDDRSKDVRSYEHAHKNRAGVLKAAERELTNA